MRALLAVLASLMPLHATTYYITIAGLGGAPEYEQRFSGWAKDIETTLRGSAGTIVETLYGAAATKSALRAVMSRFGREAKPEDALVVMLIGHGNFDGVDYKINLPGPDLSAVELAAFIEAVHVKRQLVVNMTSCSGAALPALKKQNRVVITATKGAAEKNATIFPRYWVEALRDRSADTDKNEVISALEAFRFAAAKTSGFYQAQKRLATEHALLDDTGEGEGVKDPSVENGVGLLASKFPLLNTSARQAMLASPANKTLLAHKEELEQQIDKLKYERITMPADQYSKKMADLLLDLAKTQAALDK